MSAVILIPARWASTRFPGKPLAMIAGVSLIQRVYERAQRARRAKAIFVATDDARIADHVSGFGGQSVQPRGDFQSGSDRIAAALDLLGEEFDQVVNVQGDEPLIDPGIVDSLIEALQTTKCDMATLGSPLGGEKELQSRDIVKVVAALDGTALYFSRAPLAGAMRHIGLYGYQTPVLKKLAALSPSPLERAESLEQLRALQNGFKIRLLQTSKPHLGVDRPEDVLRVEQELASMADREANS
jgi:3-deoxy-manno-octulosonate cytidylyltransferase (CMP-KDO synthetase)